MKSGISDRLAGQAGAMDNAERWTRLRWVPLASTRPCGSGPPPRCCPSSGIQLGLSPLGARALLGLPAGELANIDLDAADLLGSFAREIRERVHAEHSWPARFAVLDRMLQSA